MNYRSAILTVLMTSPAVSGQEAVFESKGWPGEGIPVLIARHAELAVYASPDLRSAQGKVRYRIGWRIPFADSLQRTLTEAEVRTVGAGSVEVWCNDNREKLQLTISAGESWTYLQYSSEGFVTAQIRDKICQQRGGI